MRKSLVYLFVLLLISSCAQGQRQNDFYGTWVNDEGSKMEYLITSTIFTSTYTPRTVSLMNPVDQNTFEIFSWVCYILP